MGCIFCGIVAGSIPSDKIYEDDEILAFHDINPAAPTHILFIPKQRFTSLAAIAEGDAPLLGRLLVRLSETAARLGLTDYRVVTNTGADAGQTVEHLHFHLLAGCTMRNMV
jgi:histidine triad (HIT) family protein